MHDEAPQQVSTAPVARPEIVEQLSWICRLWGQLELRHPRLARGDPRWDALLCACVRRILDREPYLEVVEHLLAPLNDPCTRLVDEWAEVGTETREDVEGIAIVARDFDSYWTLDRDLAEAIRSTGDAPLLLDLRHAWLHKTPAWTLEQLASTDIALADVRCRFHSGFDSGSGSGGYYSATQTGDTTHVRGKGPSRAVVVVADLASGQEGIRLAAGLRKAGVASLVWAGPRAAPMHDWIDVGNDRKVGIRWAETDGGEAQPDVVCAAPACDRFLEVPAIASAIELLRAGPTVGVAEVAHGPDLPDPQPVETTSPPCIEQRVLALARYWNVVAHFFPYHHLLDEPWDGLLEEHLPAYLEADTTEAYGRALAGSAVRTQDSHSWLNYAPLNASTGTHSPRVKLAWIEHATVVIASDVADVAPGNVIVAIDDVPISTRLEQIGALRAHSTPQALWHHTHQIVLAGEEKSMTKLRLASGASVSLTRTDKVWEPSKTLPAFGVLPSGFGYFDLEQLTVDQTSEAFEHIRQTPALIIDLRCYPQGTAWSIGPRLAERRVVAAQFRRPEVRVDGIEASIFEQWIEPADMWRYDKPVVVLINEAAISQSEHTCMWFQAATDVTFVGSPTQGANGDVTRIDLPGASLMMTGHDVRHADGRQLQRIGIQPDIEVRPTIRGVRAGRDEVLEAAVTHLRTGPTAPNR